MFKKIVDWVKANKGRAVVVGLAVLFFVVAVIEFLSHRDTPTSLTGWEVLGKQGAGFWFGVIFWGAVGTVTGWLGLRAIGKSGSLAGLGPFLFGLSIFLVLMFGKACTDKASSEPVPVDGDRVPAHELVK